MASSVSQAPAQAAPSAESAPVFVDTQHDDTVHDAQLDFYGCKLATCSSDRTIKIYNVSETSYELTATLQGHEGPVWQVSWSHPKFGVLLASCSFDGSVLIHRETRPRDWTLLHGAQYLHASSVNGIAFAPPEFGLHIAAASSDGRVSILSHEPDNSWSAEYIEDNALGVNAVSWAPSGAYVTASDDAATQQQQTARLVTAGCDNQIRFYRQSSETGQWEGDASAKVSKEGPTHSDWVRDVAWAPVLVPNHNMVASCSEDKSVLIWTQENGSGSEWKSTLLNTFDAPVWSVSWSSTGHMLAVSSGDNDVTMWKQALDGKWTKMSTSEAGGPTQG
mmetsp:Transcript_8043/g.21735  ORF Transcript_8043/g.21735 Transcript_8043/m.21735 type:complete len:334 (-) Transcript_8043:190-1191(-)|eukprot:CAMPEP_0198126318 /NCGR_PEP_ID=MMETSP1442-20131203/44537_1 /TAXON_ID= /ORGANISM="Craspedostauros australis, Strain CCMP3328" /LENGTH=333 /DNA_ID=CAMNT_0043786079 /DNA_START=54 /DNA_END=1055 /DNA_ORIENTATION=-